MEQSTAPAEADAPLTNPLDVERPTTAPAAVIESTGGLEFDPEFAGFGHRFVGFLIDSMILVAFVAPGLLVMLAGSSGVSIAIGVGLVLVGIGLATWWSARSVATSGQWIGNRVTNTRVVDSRNGSMLDGFHAGTRFLARQFVSTVFFLGFLPALFDSQRRTFHDRIVDSVVVRPPRARWVAGGDADEPDVA